jgi:hypothetical protein
MHTGVHLSAQLGSTVTKLCVSQCHKGGENQELVGRARGMMQTHRNRVAKWLE